MYGSARRQLMQEYVQKSMTTTLPLSAAFVSGFELSHVVAPLSSGMSPSIAGAASPDLLDIIPAPAGASEVLPPAMASLAAGFADIIIAEPFVELPASACGAASSGAPRAASATSRGVG